MAKFFFLIGALAALMVGAGPLHAQQTRDLFVVEKPSHGVMRVLPEHRGIVYVGTGAEVDSFSFGTADENGVGWTDVTIDPVLETVSIECEDWGGPTVTGYKLAGLGSSSDSKAKDDDERSTGDTPPEQHHRRGYMLIILVDQPGDGGDRDTWEGPIFNPSVGHAFIQLVDGDTGRVRTFGFYGRDAFITPINSSSAGEIRDDSDHAYDVSLEIDITEEQYHQLIEEILDDAIDPPEYDLNDHNCVDWVLELIQTIGLHIDTARGTWPFGGGHNPGDFGEDIIDEGGTRNN